MQKQSHLGILYISSCGLRSIEIADGLNGDLTLRVEFVICLYELGVHVVEQMCLIPFWNALFSVF